MSEEQLIFSISGRRLAVAVDFVTEIADRGSVVVLPQLPAAIPGIVDVRGTPVPVIDLGALSGDAPRHDHRAMVIVSDGIRPMALLIDEVEEIESAGSVDGDVPVIDVLSLMERIA